MARSYHTTRKSLKGKTKKEINEMVDDQDSVLNELVKKRMVKKESLSKRRKHIKKKMNNTMHQSRS